MLWHLILLLLIWAGYPASSEEVGISADAERCITEAADNPDLAIQFCDRAIQNYQGSEKAARTLIARGDAYRTKGDFDRAIVDYTAAAQTRANAAQGYGSRGTAIATLSKPEYNRTIAIVFRGIAWMQQREFDAAIADFSQAISLDPNYTTALVNRGMAHRLKGEFDRAIEDLSAAMMRNSSSSDFSALLERGEAYRERGEYHAAIADFTTAIQRLPILSLAFYRRGKAYQALGQNENARADYRKALALHLTPEEKSRIEAALKDLGQVP